MLTRDKGTPVGEKQEFQETFAVRRSSQVGCNSLDIVITSYRGPLDQPTWMDSERGTSIRTVPARRLSVGRVGRSILDAVHRACRYDQVGPVDPAKAKRRRGVVLYVGDQGDLVVWTDGAHGAGELDGQRACLFFLLTSLTHAWGSYPGGRSPVSLLSSWVSFGYG